jgi:ketosteroid isomerase-like protein
MLRLASLAVLILLVCGATSGCAQRVDTGFEQATLFNRDTEWSRAAEGKDVEAILSFVADDAIFFPPDGPMLRGKEIIRSFWSELAETPDFSVSWEATDAVVSSAGDMGYTYGLALVTRKDEEGNATTELTKYVTIWKKQPDGSWQVVVDIWNSNEPQRGVTTTPPETSVKVPRARFAVQLGAFLKRPSAEALAKRISSRYQRETLVAPWEVNGRTVYRVRILVETEAEAESLSARIGRERKLKTWIVTIP